MRHPFVLVVGPTASGKSALALKLAQVFNGGVLNCDSLQVYQCLDIGTAKPSRDERELVPHYLFDMVPPGGVLTAGDFRKVALEKLALELPNRPVIGVGGSGFYIQALEKGMFDVPKPDPKVEAQVRADADRLGLPLMFAELERGDPEYAEQISPNDSYRVLRALVILRETGHKASELRRRFQREPFPYPLLKLGLMPTREQLLPRVVERTHNMLASGLLREVESLVAAGFADWPALQSVGYRECVEYLQGQLTEAQLAPRIVEKTMQLAKKQRTWFRRDTDTIWLNPEDPWSEAETRVSALVDSLR